MTALTFFNAILLWSLMARVFMLLGNTLGALIKVVLVANALSRSGTFCWEKGKALANFTIGAYVER